MKGRLLSVLMLALGLMMLPVAASALTFTMDQTQLDGLYETGENPDGPTELTGNDPFTYLPDSILIDGEVYSNNPGDFGQIQIGANFWGDPYDGNPGDGASNVALGMGDLSGYDSYALGFTNTNLSEWQFNLYMNVGWTDPPFGETNYYIENTWTAIGPGKYGSVVLDFTKAKVWGGGYSGSEEDITTISGLNLAHVTNIGFNIGANLPLDGPYGLPDNTFEAIVSSNPIPEPATILLLGSGMLGLILGRKRLFRK